MFRRFFAILSGCFLLAHCASRLAEIPAAAPTVKQQEVVEISRAYTTMVWRPSRSNVMHGIDPAGVRVDTPDRTLGGGNELYWKPGRSTIGMPYQWGGFDTPSQFIAKIGHCSHPALAGTPAGDIASDDKVRKGDAVVSPYAAGIDCSGFVSRCWRLPRPYSTRELPAMCRRLASFSDMETGDILIKPGEHVTLFLRWADQDKTHFIGSEAAGNRYWRVVERVYPVLLFSGRGFVPMRYNNIR